MIGVTDVRGQVQNPEAPLYPLKAFVGSPSSVRVCNVPGRIGDWRLTRVYFSVEYPDGQTRTADCVRVGGVWVGTVEGSLSCGTSANGYTVYADGTDENGSPVTGYVLGQGDVVILDTERSR